MTDKMKELAVRTASGAVLVAVIVGTLSYYDSTGQSDYAFSKPYSERTAEQIDNEARELIDRAYEQAKEVLRTHADGLRELAELLLEREVVFTEDVERIFGKRKKDIEREERERKAKEAAKAEEAAAEAADAAAGPKNGLPEAERNDEEL